MESCKKSTVPTNKRFRCRVMVSQHKQVRELIVDSGSTFHLVDLHRISEEERRTIRTLAVPQPLLTAKGITWVDQECDVWINATQMTVPAMTVA